MKSNLTFTCVHGLQGSGLLLISHLGTFTLNSWFPWLFIRHRLLKTIPTSCQEAIEIFKNVSGSDIRRKKKLELWVRVQIQIPNPTFESFLGN